MKEDDPVEISFIFDNNNKKNSELRSKIVLVNSAEILKNHF